MKVLILFVAYVVLVTSTEEQFKLKVDYYNRLIQNALKQAKEYKSRQDNSDYFKDIKNEDGITDYGTFDFIVVGAGSSGSVLASRLSEVENFKVLLLEAGKLDDDLTEIPYVMNLLQSSDRDWGYYTTPQKNGCYGWKGNRCSYARGKVLGGSGSINYLAYARGNKGDYDKWASLGNPGWSFKDVLPYLQKLENFEADNIDRTYRGFAGPVNVAYKIPKENFTWIRNAYLEIGVKTIQDYNGKQQFGVSRIQRNIKHGRRVSGATGYVRPSSVRHNFNVTVEAFVTRILIDAITKSANGVEFIKNGRMFVAKARKETIISGGAINTPQLLMLSGIGPEDELNKHGIPVIENLPVGKYLKDHISLQVSYRTNISVATKSFCKYIEEYLNGEGILTNLENSVSISFFHTRNVSASVPNVEIVFFLPTPITKSMPPRSNFTADAQNYMEKLDQHTNIYFTIFLLHPKSVGTLTLQSNSPRDFPLIDIGIFSDPEDKEDFYKAIQIVNKIGKTKAVQMVDAKQIDYQFCNQFLRDSKEYWYCALEHMALPGMHMSSTVKMGPRRDPFAVVDSNLRVYGVRKLRVVDCSVIPTTISGHYNGPAFLIGEKAADIIKEAYNIPLQL